MINANKPNSGGPQRASNAGSPHLSPAKVAGTFSGCGHAGSAVNGTTRHSNGKIAHNLVAPNERPTKHSAGVLMARAEPRNYVAEGAGTGGAGGAVLGGTIGVVVASMAALSTSVTIPGLSLNIAGPAAAALLSAGVGCLIGGFLGALAGWSSLKNVY